MSIVELFVGLKIPDTTAITTLHTIEKIGYKVTRLERLIYYRFDIEGDGKKFAEKINKTDILVNVNKNTASNELKKRFAAYLLITDSGDTCQSLLSILQNRLCFREIKSMQKGIVWALFGIDRQQAEEIAKKLLYNEHYQEMKVI
ncbi:MAG TPA: hypothetical protein VJH97_00460 [Candidatus Nanoarchaeia archaeon]|nr:hypothetical protein [Candidatus Nanoarchaeia archaeon]